MITLDKVNQCYGSSQILWNLDLTILTGSVTCVMGRNGVGKTTALKVLMGLLPTTSGSIRYDDQEISHWNAERRAHAGIGYVPQGRDIFAQLTVEENLKIGLPCRADNAKKIPDKIFGLEANNNNWQLAERS